MSTMRGSEIRRVPKKEQRPAPKPKKNTPITQQEEEEHYDYDPNNIRLIPFRSWRKACSDKYDDDAPPRVDGKTKSLIKRLNKSPNSAFSKLRTIHRNRSRQPQHALQPPLF